MHALMRSGKKNHGPIILHGKNKYCPLITVFEKRFLPQSFLVCQKSKMSFDGCDTNDLDFDNVAVLYHDVCVESQERPPVVSTSKVQWPTSLALLLVEACVEYCKNHNILLLNFDDSAIDWYAMVATIKWPEARHKTVHECVKKLKYIRNLWVCGANEH